MIIAFHCQTESNDRYMFLEDVNTPEDFITLLKNKLGQELLYVYEREFKSYPTNEVKELDRLYKVLIKEAYEEYGG